ncbi:riboflavin synthase [Candidatus Nitrosocosmicus arcticus]|uniref:Riboflavin synthase n=1 Tax=Candidatus Nitrosocosmicus arcticus TaxID=2035267 RepID=A0A557SXK1_9ARCH|nr:riboflavin synthase [Candidatus Nitrosocosmicus arcticus]TVP41336.1 riboflavin synthase, alpha chain [Candidatus Nitrosocosmicus arcticus]
MFTGITEYLGEIENIEKSKSKRNKKSVSKANHHIEITLILPESKDIKIGDSVSINGVCLTVSKFNDSKATFQVIDETIKRTNFIDLKIGDKVNVERSLSIGGRLEGHFVLGHIDGTGIIKKLERGDLGSKIKIEILDKELLPLIAQKGSIAIDGISLTVVSVRKSIVEIALIPHTLENTTLGIKRAGDAVNIEADILSRYISNIYQFSGNNKKNSKIY